MWVGFPQMSSGGRAASPIRATLGYMTRRSENVVRQVRGAGGVMRTRGLRQAGFSAQDITDAVRAGQLVRERRVWVATPGAEAALRYAARGGVVLSCVTQAARQGLWVLDSTRAHVACDPHASAVRAPGAIVHRHIPLVPRDPAVLFDPIENVPSGGGSVPAL
jgi:hypothetical protein